MLTPQQIAFYRTFGYLQKQYGGRFAEGSFPVEAEQYARDVDRMTGFFARRGLPVHMAESPRPDTAGTDSPSLPPPRPRPARRRRARRPRARSLTGAWSFGDELEIVEVEIDGLGRLANHVVDWDVDLHGAGEQLEVSANTLHVALAIPEDEAERMVGEGAGL